MAGVSAETASSLRGVAVGDPSVLEGLLGAQLEAGQQQPDPAALEELAQLRDQGIVAEEEFTQQKQRILGS